MKKRSWERLVPFRVRHRRFDVDPAPVDFAPSRMITSVATSTVTATQMTVDGADIARLIRDLDVALAAHRLDLSMPGDGEVVYAQALAAHRQQAVAR